MSARAAFREPARTSPRATPSIALVALAALVAFAAPARAQGEHTQQPTGSQRPSVTTHDTLQPAQLPPLPAGMTLETIAQGDSVFHGAGNCFACHGMEGEGRPGAGNAITVSLNWAQYDWRSIDSLITHGIPQTITRSPMMMPPRGGKSNLTDEQVRRVAAYVWAISQARGEPWPGGHRSHGALVPAGADEGTATRTLVRRRPPASRGTRR